MMKEIVKRLSEECFEGQQPLVLGTGGFASLFESENFFTSIQSDLVLFGLKVALHLNQHSRRS
jgi:type III pantothenate kinase